MRILNINVRKNNQFLGPKDLQYIISLHSNSTLDLIGLDKACDSVPVCQQWAEMWELDIKQSLVHARQDYY